MNYDKELESPKATKQPAKHDNILKVAEQKTNHDRSNVIKDSEVIRHKANYDGNLKASGGTISRIR